MPRIYWPIPEPADPIPSTMPVMVEVARFDFYARPKSAGQVITRKVFTLPTKKPNANIVASHAVCENH